MCTDGNVAFCTKGQPELKCTDVWDGLAILSSVEYISAAALRKQDVVKTFYR